MDCAGANVVLGQGIGIARNGCGQIVKIGYDEKPIGISLDPLFDGVISIQGHYGYDWVSWRKVINLIVAGKLDLKSMISHKMTLSQFREAFDFLREKKYI